jgi:hypothetical protein
LRLDHLWWIVASVVVVVVAVTDVVAVADVVEVVGCCWLWLGTLGLTRDITTSPRCPTVGTFRLLSHTYHPLSHAFLPIFVPSPSLTPSS